MDFDFSRDECLNLETSLRQEWLETNGIGGYASSTILDCHTRKYHGLLVCPVPEHNSSFVFLSKVEAAIHVHGKVFHFSTNKYPGVFEPTGHKYIEEFRGAQYPMVLYRVGDIQLRRSVLMVEGQNAVMLKYELIGADVPVRFHLTPLLAYRDIHTLRMKTDDVDSSCTPEANGLKMTPCEGLPSLYLDTSMDSEFSSKPAWILNLEYLKERSRGFDYQESLFSPGTIELPMHAGESVILRASLAPTSENSNDLWRKELSRRQALMNQYRRDPQAIRVLKSRARQFLTTNHRGKRTVIAGYPWFGEWSRDAMISLPGLTIGCGKPRAMVDVLKTFAGYEKDGLFPNFIPLSDDDEIPYNSSDASLWFFWCIQKYVRTTADLAVAGREFFPVMLRILKAIAEGRCPKTNVQEDGLLWTGDRSSQLTWMDARIDGIPVTPRHGLVVEINALWYNALHYTRDLSKQLKVKFPPELEEICGKLGEAFVNRFWDDQQRYLADVINEFGVDDSLRPNQIFAASLPFSPLNDDQKKAVIAAIVRSLLTPYGLRTLSPGNPNYIGEYSGSPEERDSAYHQGTVWPWLLGHFVEAYLATAEKPDEVRERLKWELGPIFGSHLRQGCLGTICEIFNGDPPHTRKGCPSQAWSVAEVIRTWNMLNGRIDES